MRTVTKMYQEQTSRNGHNGHHNDQNGHQNNRQADDARLLRESDVHKLVITDRDGNCLAYLLAWDGFVYDAETDAFVCCVERDGRELMNIYAEGEVKRQPGTDMYVVTAPDACAEVAYRDTDEAVG